MSKGTDWESVMFHMHQDSRLMEVHEAFVDLISGRTGRYNALDAFNGGFFDFGNVFVEEDYTDDDSDYEDRKDKKEFCGFPRNFLDHGPPRSRSPHTIHPPYRPGLREIMHEQAEKNAKELVEEEEKLKIKAEKKKLKKSKQKERKRKEQGQDQENTVKNNDVDSPEVEDSKSSNSVNGKSDKEAAYIPNTGPTVPLKKAQASAASVRNKTNSNGPSEDAEEDEEEEKDNVNSIASELEVLDMNSYFVSKAATIAKRKLELKAKPEKKEEKNRSSRKQEPQQEPQQKQQQQQQHMQRQLAESPQRGVEPQQPPPQQQNAVVASIEDVIKRSTELAVIGNQLGNAGRFDMAVVYFTDAIKHNPKDFRLFGNRSFCYEKMQQYEKALIDANISVTMSPGWKRGLYRRGRALAGLKRYCEAAEAFKEVLQHDSTSSDAAQELMRVQIMQLMEMGFSREQSSNALIIHGTVDKALEAFSNIQDDKFGSSNPPLATASQPSAEEEWVVAGLKAQLPVNPATKPQTQPISYPRPPMKSCPAKFEPTPELFPVWVGNLVPTVTERMVHELFSTAGPVHSVRLLPSRRCAFVNYTRRRNCITAIAEFHGWVLEGAVMCVRYPDRIPTHLGASKSAQQATKKSDECFYWRNGGCVKEERCTFKHIPSHKGIDKGKDKLAP